MFYAGLHQPSDAAHFERAFISINRVRGRQRLVPVADWILDSGAFRELEQWGHYRHEPAEYAREVNRLAAINPGLRVAVSQDWMCEPFMLAKTGLDVAEHQRRTIERYDALLPLVNVTLMPVLQGYALTDYLNHLDQYGDRLKPDMLVGVGSICKRNTDVHQIEAILSAIKRKRPDLRLHGFGIKTTALGSGVVRDCLHSADSMAWSFAARRQGRDQNDWREARAFAERIETMPVQYRVDVLMAAGLDFLEQNYGKMTLWEWAREWIEVEMQSDDDEHIDLLEYLYLRAGNADEGSST